jgi:hypothetical protein
MGGGDTHLNDGIDEGVGLRLVADDAGPVGAAGRPGPRVRGDQIAALSSGRTNVHRIPSHCTKGCR